MEKILRFFVVIGLVVMATGAPVMAQEGGPSAAPTSTVDVHGLAPVVTAKPISFDPQKATAAYLAQISGSARARSDAYFEGGYVLIFVDAVYAVAISALLLWSKFSARMRNYAQNWTRSRFLQVQIYVLQYLTAFTVLSLPLTIYEGFIREKSYGLMNQTLAAWSIDQGKGFILTLVAGVIVLPLIYAAIRRSKRNWWLWGAGIATVFLAIQIIITPVFIAPLFNTYSPLPQSLLKADVLSLARANGIPAENVYLFDASRQSDRISANVSGFLGTTRISMNDNLLHKGTHDEVLAVLGHEMGHYVLDHAFRLLLLNALVFLAAFAFVNWGFGWLAALFGGSWDARSLDDPAGLPVLVALFTIFMLLATPVNNTITRTTEIQADMFGINAARKPDGFATAVLKLSNYRKLDPSPWEEAIFYDHPSAHTRIWEAMRWKAEHLTDPDIKTGPVSPQ